MKQFLPKAKQKKQQKPFIIPIQKLIPPNYVFFENQTKAFYQNQTKRT